MGYKVRYNNYRKNDLYNLEIFMFAKKNLEELTRKLFDVLPESMQVLDKEIQNKFNDILQIAFTKLDLVTREEFDVQLKVLARTREKVENLEAALAKFTQDMENK